MKGEPLRRVVSSEDDDEETKRAVAKKVESRTFDQLYSVVMGLPGRVRQYMRRVRKLQAQGLTDAKLADELSALAKKILDDRLDVVMMVPARLNHDKKTGSDKEVPEETFVKMTNAAAECDALLTLTAYYFLPGISASHALIGLRLSEHPILRTQVSGIADVIDYALFSKAQRASRQKGAREVLKDHGWDLPEPEESK